MKMNIPGVLTRCSWDSRDPDAVLQRANSGRDEDLGLFGRAKNDWLWVQ
jgi:hypothetical protein